MTGNKESKPFRKDRRWIETSSSDSSNEQKGRSLKDLIENVDKIERIECNKIWHATNLGEA